VSATTRLTDPRPVDGLINHNITGEILEIGAFWSIRTKAVPSFDRYFSQLQTFYNDYRQVSLPPFSTGARCSSDNEI